MVWLESSNMEDVLNEVSAKQDRLELRLEKVQAVILEQLRGLKSSNDVTYLDRFVTPYFESEPYDDCNGARSPLQSPRQSQYGYQESQNGKPQTPIHTPNSLAARKTKLNTFRVSVARIVDEANLTGKTDFSFDRPPQTWRRLSTEEARRISETRRISILTAAISNGTEAPTETVERTSLTQRVRRFAQTSMRQTLYGSINQRDTVLVNLVRHPFFQSLCGTVVILNSVLIGASVEIEANGSSYAEDDLEALSHVCSVFFILELIVRIAAHGCNHFFRYADDRWMNLLDTLLVILSILDFTSGVANVTQASDTSDVMMVRILKTVRLLRILRIFKIFRFFAELHIMLFMICECMSSLFWAVVLLLIIMYTFAIIFTQSATTYRNKDGTADHSEIEEKFGTMARTTYYLFQSMLGGISWGLVTDTMVKFDKVSTALFFFYISFTMLAVLNIITGIFVDNALETSRMQRDYIIKREQRAKGKAMKELSRIFDEMDDDESGTISWEEMATALQDSKTRTYFSALGLNTDDMRQVFDMMDYDCSGTVDLEEFLDGCGRCAGDAKSMDIQSLIHEVKRLHKRFDKDLEIPSLQHQKSMSDNIPGDNAASIQLEVKTMLKAWSRSVVAELRQLKGLSKLTMQMIESAARRQNHSPVKRPDSLFSEFTGRSQ